MVIFKNTTVMKLKYTIDYKGLESFLRSLNYSEIQTTWQKPVDVKLIEVTTMDNIEYLKLDKSTIPADTIIEYGEPFMVDALGNDLSIVILSRRKYKLPNGRAIQAKFVTTVIDDCRALYGTPLNGYWKIPCQFLKHLPI